MFKIIKIFTLFSFVLCIHINASAQQNWKDINTVEEVCTYYPETIANMLDQFNLDYPGLEKVKQEHKKGNVINACNELLSYYKNGNTASDLGKTLPEKTCQTKAETGDKSPTSPMAIATGIIKAPITTRSGLGFPIGIVS